MLGVLVYLEHCSKSIGVSESRKRWLVPGVRDTFPAPLSCVIPKVSGSTYRYTRLMYESASVLEAVNSTLLRT